MPDNITLRELQMFHGYFFKDLLELHDWDIQNRFYFMPRFVRDLPENGKEILSMNVVMSYLLKSYLPVVDEMDLIRFLDMEQMEWQNNITEPIKGELLKKYQFDIFRRRKQSIEIGFFPIFSPPFLKSCPILI